MDSSFPYRHYPAPYLSSYFLLIVVSLQLFLLASSTNARLTHLSSTIDRNLFNSQDVSSVCKFMNDVFLQSNNVLGKFEGEIIPLRRGRTLLAHFDFLRLPIYCLLPTPFSFDTKIDNIATAKISTFQQTTNKFITKPKLVTLEQAQKACVLGCLKLPYEIKAPNKHGVVSSLYVTVVTEREKMVCPSAFRKVFLPLSNGTTSSSTSSPNSFNVRSSWNNCVPDRPKLKKLVLKKRSFNRSQFQNNLSDLKYFGVKNRQISSRFKVNGQQLCDSVSTELGRQYKRNFGKSILSATSTYLVYKNSPVDSSNILLPISVFCIKPPTGISKLIPLSSSAMTKIYCPFDCERRSYYYKPTGQAVQFLFARECVPSTHNTCSEKYGFKFKRTNHGSRLPVPSIFEVTSYNHDREHVVQRAIQKLRYKPGFSSTKRSDIADTKVIKKGKNFFKVFLYFEQKFLEI